MYFASHQMYMTWRCCCMCMRVCFCAHLHLSTCVRERGCHFLSATLFGWNLIFK